MLLLCTLLCQHSTFEEAGIVQTSAWEEMTQIQSLYVNFKHTSSSRALSFVFVPNYCTRMIFFFFFFLCSCVGVSREEHIFVNSKLCNISINFILIYIGERGSHCFFSHVTLCNPLYPSDRHALPPNFDFLPGSVQPEGDDGRLQEAPGLFRSLLF